MTAGPRYESLHAKRLTPPKNFDGFVSLVRPTKNAVLLKVDLDLPTFNEVDGGILKCLQELVPGRTLEFLDDRRDLLLE